MHSTRQVASPPTQTTCVANVKKTRRKPDAPPRAGHDKTSSMSMFCTDTDNDNSFLK